MKFFLPALLFTLTSQAQTEIITNSDGTSTAITATETGMYNGTESEEAQKFYDQAFEFARAGSYEKAIEYYWKSIGADSTFVEAYDNVGQIYRRTKDYDKAIECYKKSIELYPQGDMAHQNLALIYSLREQYDLAEGEYQTLIDLNKTNPEGYFGLANVYLLTGNYEPGIDNAMMAKLLYTLYASPLLHEAEYMLGLLYYYSGDLKNAKKSLKAAKKAGMEIHPSIEKALKL
jgi:tetratricopeptide (TPR) repeat protein